MDKITEEILRRRMHGLYLSRTCDDLEQLAGELMGMHCWFHRNVAFSAVIRGADLTGWKSRLTKTWLYRGTLHGVNYDDLPNLLSLHGEEPPWGWIGLSRPQLEEAAERVVALMEDGVYSRARMRTIFADDYDHQVVERMFSPWGGIFVYLARRGRVSFRNMASRDFDLISAEPTMTAAEALPGLLKRFFRTYGPATLADAGWFFGLDKEWFRDERALGLDELERLEVGKEVYYYEDTEEEMGDIPRLTLLAGFDPYLVSYTKREAMLPPEYKKAVINKAGICLPTVAVDGVVSGLWNLKNGAPVVEFFSPQPKSVRDEIMARAEDMARRVAGRL